MKSLALTAVLAVSGLLAACDNDYTIHCQHDLVEQIPGNYCGCPKGALKRGEPLRSDGGTEDYCIEVDAATGVDLGSATGADKDAGNGASWVVADAGRDAAVGLDAQDAQPDASPSPTSDASAADASTGGSADAAAVDQGPVTPVVDAGAPSATTPPVTPPAMTTPPVTTPPVTMPPKCVPTTEVCDKKDNNCDGTVDEGFATGGSCTAGKGECLATGTLQCEASGAVACTATPKAAAAAEICGDGKDNECDGMVDDGCPSCGNGIVESGETCDGDTWHCSPDCKKRSIYTACDGAAGALCEESTVACYENLCVPQVSNYDVASCPKVVGGYQVAITFGQGCVLACNASSDCPPHLPRCMDNPFVDADPRETKRYCWRSF